MRLVRALSSDKWPFSSITALITLLPENLLPDFSTLQLECKRPDVGDTSPDRMNKEDDSGTKRPGKGFAPRGVGWPGGMFGVVFAFDVGW